MSMRDDYGTARSGDRVEVAPGYPTDRVRWGPILAGTFGALTALAVLTTLGTAIGLSAYDPGDNPRNFAIGSGVWGIISMILSFAFGGWLAARSAAIRGSENGMLNGFMVAGVAIPLLMFVIGSAATALSHAEVTNNRDTASARANPNMSDMATQAGATLQAGDNQADPQRVEEASRRGARGAWSALAGLLLAIGAASVGGRMGAKDDHSRDRDTRHHHTTTTTSGGNPTL